ncbi:MAG TPA: hypothetical protein PLF96_02510 [Thermotogota bacterium]|nr:hypothetical protein [Thermotogota bacterium]
MAKGAVFFLLWISVFSTLCFSQNNGTPMLTFPSTVSPDASGVLHPILSEMAEKYSSSIISGTRIFMESGEKVRYRYEYVLRSGFEKIVSLKMPYTVSWFRAGGKGFLVQNGVRAQVPVPLKDLEDVFLEKIRQNVTVGFAEISYSGIPAYYLYLECSDTQVFRAVVLKGSLQIIRIESEKPGSNMVMLYDNLTEASESEFQEQLSLFFQVPEVPFEETPSPTETIPPAQISQPDEDSGETQDLELDAETAQVLGSFFPATERLREEFSILRTEALLFPDSTALFLTLDIPQANPVVAVLIRNPRGFSEQGNSPFLEKIPENFNSVQINRENLDIHVLGEHPKQDLQKIAQTLLALTFQP